MSVGWAETSIFVPNEKLKPVIRDLREARFEVLPHQVRAVHSDKDGDTAGQMVDVLGSCPQLAQTLARIFTAYGLEELNNPIFIFPFE